MEWLFLSILLSTLFSLSTPVCGPSKGHRLASKMLQASINFSADPCESLYEFACGGWVDKHEIPSTQKGVSVTYFMAEEITEKMKYLLESPEVSTSKSINMIKAVYNRCMDTDSIEKDMGREIVEQLKQISIWPMVQQDMPFDPDEFDFTKVYAELYRRGCSPLFRLSIAFNDKNSSIPIIEIDKIKWPANVETKDKHKRKQADITLQYTMETALLLAEDYGLCLEDDEKLTEASVSLRKFGKLLKEVCHAPSRDPTSRFNIFTLSTLQEEFPLIDWRRFFSIIAPNETQSYFDEDPEIKIPNLEYLRALDRVLAIADTRVVADFLLFNYVTMQSAYLREAYHEVRRILYSEKYNPPPRWKTCIGRSKMMMPLAYSALHSRNHVSSDTKEKFSTLVENIRDTFTEVLSELDWMDEDTKKAALEKATLMREFIGNVEYEEDDEELDAFYSDLPILPTDSLYVMGMKQQQYAIGRQFVKLLKPVDKDNFLMASTTVNAYYLRPFNLIAFPAAFLQPPLYHPTFPEALNFGAIGSVIGHEITHGFDDIGSRYDAMGDLNNWWKKDTKDKFLRKAQCVIDQYANYTYPYLGPRLARYRAMMTQGENIADNGGVRVALKAFKSQIGDRAEDAPFPYLPFTNEQLFFLGYAQYQCFKNKKDMERDIILRATHPLGKFRVDVVTRNQEEYAKAFNCPAGSYMNPETRCSVW